MRPAQLVRADGSGGAKYTLFLAFLMNRNTEGAVRLVFDCLKKRLGTYEFLFLFEYILTDRGSEFRDPDSLETGITGFQRSNIDRLIPCFVWYSPKRQALNF